MSAGMLATTHTTTMQDISVAHALVQMVIALAVIVGGIWILSKVLARVRQGGSAGARRKAPAKGLTVISRQPLGKDLSIAAVSWRGREILVGISGSTITFLNDPGTGVNAAPLAGAEALAGSGTRRARKPVAGPGETELSEIDATHQTLLALQSSASGRAALARPAGRLGALASGARTAPKRSMLDALRDATLRR